MSRFNVDTDGLRSAAGRCDDISGSITGLGDQIRDVKYSLNNEMGRYSGVMSALDTCYTNSRRCSNKVSQYGSVGIRIANEYTNTENSVSGNIKLDKFGNVVNDANKLVDPQAMLNFLHNNPLGPNFFAPFIIGGIPISALWFIINDLYEADSPESKTDVHFKQDIWDMNGIKYKWDFKNKKWVKQESKDGEKVNPARKEYSFLEREFDPKSKKWVEPEEKEEKTGFEGMEKEVKLHEWKADAPSAEVWGTSGSKEGEYGKLEGSVDFVKAETHADAYAGILRAGGTVGASVTAFTATGLAQLGDDNLGGYVSGTVTVGKVGAEASGSIGLFDKYGNVNPNVEVGASAEAIGGEISGKVGAKILGTDVGVEGSVNYGVGAHANFGFGEGKFYVDIGASVGVGGSIKLDIDMSGTVNAVCDTAKAAWNGIKGLFGH